MGHTHKEECYVTMEAEIGMMNLQTKDGKFFWQSTEARKEAWNRLFLRVLQKESILMVPWFHNSTVEKFKRIYSCCLIHTDTLLSVICPKKGTHSCLLHFIH